MLKHHLQQLQVMQWSPLTRITSLPIFCERYQRWKLASDPLICAISISRTNFDRKKDRKLKTNTNIGGMILFLTKGTGWYHTQRGVSVSFLEQCVFIPLSSLLIGCILIRVISLHLIGWILKIFLKLDKSWNSNLRYRQKTCFVFYQNSVPYYLPTASKYLHSMLGCFPLPKSLLQ